MDAQAVLRLPAEPIAAALARAGLERSVRSFSEETRANVALLTTELVSNALKHATQAPTDEILVRVTADSCIRVEVVDPAPPFPPLRSSRPTQPMGSGWGLYLLDSLADAWGVEVEGSGKKVWFELTPTDV